MVAVLERILKVDLEELVDFKLPTGKRDILLTELVASFFNSLILLCLYIIDPLCCAQFGEQ